MNNSLNLKNKQIFVTGADGFIGSHLVEKLVTMGASVKALCCYNSYGSLGWLEDLDTSVLNSVEIVFFWNTHSDRLVSRYCISWRRHNAHTARTASRETFFDRR